MKNKINIIYILCVAIITIVGITILFLNKTTPTNTTAGSGAKSTDTISPEPTYPKIDKYDIPILMYHYIRDASNESELGQKLSVNPSNFDLQLKWLKENDYETVSMNDLADVNRTNISKIYFEKKKPIILTFDDGYKDAYTDAYPILKKHGMTGTFYIIRDSVGSDSYMGQAQIDELEKAGNEIGSHTISHPSLEKLSEADQHVQIFDSKLNAKSFCYPAGKYNNTTVKLVKDAGYLTAVTTKTGIASQDSNLFELPRVRVEDGDGVVLQNKIKYAEDINK